MMGTIERQILGETTTLKITMRDDHAQACAPVIAEIAEKHGAEFRTISSRPEGQASFYVINSAREPAFTAAVSSALNIQLQPAL